MCNPALLVVASTAVTMAGQYQSGMYAAGQARYGAKVAEQNKSLEREAASDAIVRGQDEQRKLGREVAGRVGAQEARMAGNNIDITTGSAARVIDDTLMLGREDSAAISENVRRQVRERQINAWNFESEKRAMKAEAKQAKTATYFGMASTALGGATQYSKYKTAQGSGGGSVG